MSQHPPHPHTLHHPRLFRCGRGRRRGARQLLALKRLRVNDDLDDKVLLDLGVLEAGLIREQLPREEPALVCRVDVMLGLQLLLQLPDGVGHAGTEAQVSAGGESHLRREEKVNTANPHTLRSQHIADVSKVFIGKKNIRKKKITN